MIGTTAAEGESVEDSPAGEISWMSRSRKEHMLHVDLDLDELDEVHVGIQIQGHHDRLWRGEHLTIGDRDVQGAGLDLDHPERREVVRPALGKGDGGLGVDHAEAVLVVEGVAPGGRAVLEGAVRPVSVGGVVLAGGGGEDELHVAPT